jgi:phospholipid/cholesterol/gamma-HCH transport system substrate-binding protein
MGSLKEFYRNFRLGIFVAAGSALLIIGLYIIGDRQNFFGDVFRVETNFKNVNGLRTGNNVRFAGIDVGTVESIEIISDSAVKVILIIDEDYHEFIRKNCRAVITTDGLMGNKIVSIEIGDGASEVVEDGERIATKESIDTDQMIRTLSTTNENIKQITEDLLRITEKINSPNSLWSLLMDTTMAENVKATIVSIRQSGKNTMIATGDFSSIVADIKNGKGNIGALITDTTISSNIRQSVVTIRAVSDSMLVLSGDVNKLSQQISSGEGTLGTLIMDTTLVHNLNESVASINKGSADFANMMDALKQSRLMKKYFRRREKAAGTTK